MELRYRPFCFQSTLSSFNLSALKTGYIQQRQGCFSNEFNTRKNICFPHIFSNKHRLTQSFERSRNVNFDNTSMESPVLVPSVTEALNSKPFDFTQNTQNTQNLLEDPNKEYHPLITKGNLQPLPWTVSRKDYIQKEYQSNIKGIRHNHLLRIVQT